MNADGIVFSESFEDADLADRNWYDGTRFNTLDLANDHPNLGKSMQK